MPDKYLKESSGSFLEVEATATSSGAGSAGDIVALNGAGKIDDTMLPTVATVPAVASESLSAGNAVNIWNDAGTVKVRKADAANGKQCHGFVKSSYDTDDDAVVYRDGIETNQSSLTPAAIYYLSTTAGAITATAPSGSGNLVQKVGLAISTTSIEIELGPVITKA